MLATTSTHVLNPKTKRWVLVNGKIGKQILATASTTSSESKNTNDVEKKCLHKTLLEWIEFGGYTLDAGEGVEVVSGINTYIVKCSKSGNCVYCSCPAWKYQRLPPRERTCKHCVAVTTGSILHGDESKTTKSSDKTILEVHSSNIDQDISQNPST